MSLTAQEKQNYVDIINAIWGAGSIPDNVVGNISDEVVSVMEDVLSSIRDCSMAMIGIDLVFSIFYDKTFATWRELLKTATDTVGKSGKDWLDVLRNSSRYKICVNTAAAANRSRVQMALAGI